MYSEMHDFHCSFVVAIGFLLHARCFVVSTEAKGIMAQDPFVTLDEEGVGELIKVAMNRGLSTRHDEQLATLTVLCKSVQPSCLLCET